MTRPSRLPLGSRQDDSRIDEGDLAGLRRVIEGEPTDDGHARERTADGKGNWMMSQFTRWLRHEAAIR